MRYTFLLGPGLLLTTIASPAQNFLGVSTNPNSGTHRTYLNPALAADSPHSFYVNIGAANVHVNNNFVQYQAPYSILTLLLGNVPQAYKRADGSIQFESSYTKEIDDNRPKNATVWGEVRGPAIRLPMGDNGSLTLSTRLRGVSQILGASKELLSALRASLSDNTLYSIPNRDNRFSVGANVYSEFALTYARPLIDGDATRLLGGFTLKYLRGFTAGYLTNQGLDYALQSEPTPPNNPYLQISRLQANLGFTNYLQNRRLNARTLFASNIPGKGVGADFGLSLMSQPEEGEAVWQLSLAITDIGTIRYQGEAYNVNKQNIKFTAQDFNDISITNPEQVAEVVREKLNLSAANSLGHFNMGLPTALNLSADYQSTSALGINLIWLQDLHGNKAAAVRQPSLVSVVPRFNTKLLTVSVPITYLNKSLLLGLSARLGPFWLGSDNILGLIGNGRNGIHPRGTDLYAGISFGF